MKKGKKINKTSKVSTHGLLALVAERLKNVDLFPKKTKDDKDFLRRMQGTKI